MRPAAGRGITAERDLAPARGSACPPGAGSNTFGGVPLQPAENRGYRELYLTGSQTMKRLGRLAAAFDGTPARELLGRGSRFDLPAP